MDNHASCAICYVEIPAPDIERAANFYRDVFGWEIGPKHNPGYWMFTAGELSGGLDEDGVVADDGVKLVLAVDDIPAKLADVEQAGGKPVQGKTEIQGGYGFYAYFRDPAGNKLGLWSKT